MTLDGAVVAWTDGKELSAKLCLNTLSPHYQAFSSSAFRLLFKNDVIDPVEEENESDHTFIADCEIDRSQPNELLVYLMRKYGTKELMNMNMGYSSVDVVMRKDDD